MLQELYSIQQKISYSIKSTIKRSLYHGISWDKRLIAIIGARGTGKTTLVLQYYKENYNDISKCLYISADNPLVLKEGIYSIGSEYFQHNGLCLIIDEVHKQINWSVDVKALYDAFPDKKIIILGSSALNILGEKGDLSRRLLVYRLPQLSFREFLNFKYEKKFSPFTFNEIIENQISISQMIGNEFNSILHEFDIYCSRGSYPFFLEYSEDEYYVLLHNIIDKVIYEDIPAISSIRSSSSMKIKKLLGFLAMSKISLFNVQSLCNEIETSKDSLYEYFDLLERADIISVTRPEMKSLRGLKNSKILFKSPNLYYAIAHQLWKHDIEKGNIRESFFAGAVNDQYRLYVSDRVDFRLYDKELCSYEIGISGKNKGKKQISNIENGYILKDGIEFGADNVIPLYLTGFLY